LLCNSPNCKGFIDSDGPIGSDIFKLVHTGIPGTWKREVDKLDLPNWQQVKQALKRSLGPQNIEDSIPESDGEDAEEVVEEVEEEVEEEDRYEEIEMIGASHNGGAGPKEMDNADGGDGNSQPLHSGDHQADAEEEDQPHQPSSYWSDSMHLSQLPSLIMGSQPDLASSEPGAEAPAPAGVSSSFDVFNTPRNTESSQEQVSGQQQQQQQQQLSGQQQAVYLMQVPPSSSSNMSPAVSPSGFSPARAVDAYGNAVQSQQADRFQPPHGSPWPAQSSQYSYGTMSFHPSPSGTF
jgi:hypothetical protein